MPLHATDAEPWPVYNITELLNAVSYILGLILKKCLR